ncbi:unnamed protein product [Closterium sp. NIES-53]
MPHAPMQGELITLPCSRSRIGECRTRNSAPHALSVVLLHCYLGVFLTLVLLLSCCTTLLVFTELAGPSKIALLGLNLLSAAVRAIAATNCFTLGADACCHLPLLRHGDHTDLPHLVVDIPILMKVPKIPVAKPRGIGTPGVRIPLRSPSFVVVVPTSSTTAVTALAGAIPLTQIPSCLPLNLQVRQGEREEEAWRQLLLLRHIRHPLTPSPRHPHGEGGGVAGGRGRSCACDCRARGQEEPPLATPSPTMLQQGTGAAVRGGRSRGAMARGDGAMARDGAGRWAGTGPGAGLGTGPDAGQFRDPSWLGTVWHCSTSLYLGSWEPLGAVSTMARPEERGGRGAGGSGEAQAQGQPRDSAMAPVQPSLGPPRDEPRVFGLDKFNCDNFAEQSFRMENIFDHYELLELMEGTEKRPENNPEKSPWVRKSSQGYLLLGQALGSSQIRHIKPFQHEPEKGPKAWAALKVVHAPATAAVAVVLEQQMAALRTEEDEAIEEGVQKFFDLLTRLEGADLNYSELQKKTKLVAILPESLFSLIINLNRDLPRLSLEDVKRAILQEDFRRRELASAEVAGAASIGRGYGCGRGRRRGGGRFGSNNFNGGRGSGGHGSDNKSYGCGRGRFKGECHYCHKSGHMSRDCFKLPNGWTPAQGQEGRGVGGGRGRGRGGRDGRGGGAANMKNGGNESESRDDRFPGQFFFVSTQAPASPEKYEGFEEPAAVGKVTLHSLDYWVIDSGATYSMTPRADLLTKLEPSPVKHVTSALGQRAEVKGMGKAMFKAADGKMVGLKNIRVVPMPKERQVAASITTKGEAVDSGDGANGRAKEIESKKCNLGGTSKLGEHKESDAAAKKQHKDEENPKAAAENEYGESMWGTIASAAFSNPTSATWECDWLTLQWRMEHVALPILQQLLKNEMVAGIRVKGGPDEVLGCPTCMQAKFTRYPFSRSEATAKAPLDEVVMDVVGPLKLGAAGAEYFLTKLDV